MTTISALSVGAYVALWLLGLTDADAAGLAAVLTPLGLVLVALIQLRSGRDVREIKQHVPAIAEKVDETHTQVTVNGHSQDKPTVLDKLEDVIDTQRQQGQQLLELQSQLDRHVDWHHGVPDDEEPDL